MSIFPPSYWNQMNTIKFIWYANKNNFNIFPDLYILFPSVFFFCENTILKIMLFWQYLEEHTFDNLSFACLLPPSSKWFYFDWDTNPCVTLISNLNEIFSHCSSSSEFDFVIYFRVLSVVSDSIDYSLDQISCLPCITGATKVADNTQSSLCTHWLNLLNS